MAVHLRLSRAGAKKAPYYHIVAADSRSPRDGAFLEQVGTYHPGSEAVTFKAEAIQKWLNNGAVPSETVRNLLKKHQAEATPATTEQA